MDDIGYLLFELCGVGPGCVDEVEEAGAPGGAVLAGLAAGAPVAAGEA
jgi:hypothetical protein